MRRRTILTFLATVLAGLAAWALSNPRVDRVLFGPYGSPPLDYLLGPLSFGLPLAVLVAAVAGYVSPRRFWLWGLAVVLLRPVVSIFMYIHAARAGVIEPSDYVGLAFVEVGFFVTFAALCTAGSGAGAGLRLVAGRIFRRRSGEAPEAASPSETSGGTSSAEEFDISEPARSFVSTVRTVLLKPTDFFRGVAPQGNLTNPLVFALVCILISGAITITLNPPGLEVMGSWGTGGVSTYIAVALAVLTAPVLAAFYVYIVAGVYHLLVMLFVRRSNAGFEATFKASAYAAAIALLTWIPVVGPLLRLYGLYLSIVGIRELHSTTTARAAAAVLIPASVGLLIVLSLVLSMGGVDIKNLTILIRIVHVFLPGFGA